MSGFSADLLGLRDWASEHGLNVDDDKLIKIANYLDVLKIWSKKLALVGTADIPVLTQKHLADCLFAAAHCPGRGHAADLGSGAGMPGIPIAIVHPGLDVDLVESRAKKVSFLSQASHGLPNAHPVNKRIEELEAGRYDFATARAVASLHRLLPLARPLLKPDGALVAMKSATHTEELAEADPEASGFRQEETRHYTLPTGEKRSLLTFRAV